MSNLLCQRPSQNNSFKRQCFSAQLGDHDEMVQSKCGLMERLKFGHSFKKKTRTVEATLKEHSKQRILPVNIDKYKRMMIEKVFPAIQARWPRGYRAKNIIIKELNARLHSKGARKAIPDAAKAEGWDIVLQPEPPTNSPDLNVLDLGFFNSIQNLQHEQLASTTNKLISVVKATFCEGPHTTLNSFGGIRDLFFLFAFSVIRGINTKKSIAH